MLHFEPFKKNRVEIIGAVHEILLDQTIKLGKIDPNLFHAEPFFSHGIALTQMITYSNIQPNPPMIWQIQLLIANWSGKINRSQRPHIPLQIFTAPNAAT